MTKKENQPVLFIIPEIPSSNEPVDPWYQAHGFNLIAGVDEVGRGALAGPVCAAAVVLGDCRIEGLNDSKLLQPDVRERLSKLIWSHADAVGLAFLSPEWIDEINILQASLEAMSLALLNLNAKPDIVLVDGNQLPASDYPAVAIVKGDSRSQAIMAASIVAKVARDSYMRKMSRMYPGYGFEDHKGYAAPLHQKALRELGLCPIHRRSYAPCRALLDPAGLFRNMPLSDNDTISETDGQP
jgi:ribonuclease HII